MFRGKVACVIHMWCLSMAVVICCPAWSFMQIVSSYATCTHAYMVIVSLLFMRSSRGEDKSCHARKCPICQICFSLRSIRGTQKEVMTAHTKAHTNNAHQPKRQLVNEVLSIRSARLTDSKCNGRWDCKDYSCDPS